MQRAPCHQRRCLLPPVLPCDDGVAWKRSTDCLTLAALPDGCDDGTKSSLSLPPPLPSPSCRPRRERVWWVEKGGRGRALCAAARADFVWLPPAPAPPAYPSCGPRRQREWWWWWGGSCLKGGGTSGLGLAPCRAGSSAVSLLRTPLSACGVCVGGGGTCLARGGAPGLGLAPAHVGSAAVPLLRTLA